MKKLLFSILCFLSFTLIACNHEEVPISQNDLPKSAQSFIDNYFANCQIAMVFKECHKYEVKFSNGFEIEFDKNGEWKEVDCQMSPIPNGIVPEAIVSYVKNNFAYCFIVQISRDKHGFDVELNNDIDLDFDKNGKFLRIDS